ANRGAGAFRSRAVVCRGRQQARCDLPGSIAAKAWACSPSRVCLTMQLARQLWSILTASQRRWVLIAQVASLIIALSTITGIAAISPFFAVLGDPGLIDRSPPLLWLYG